MTDHRAMIDNELMVAFYGCSEDTFNELVKQWRPRLELYSRRLGWSREDAEEIADDTLMKIYAGKYKATGKFDPAKSFPPWIYTITNLVAVDRHRQRERQLHTTPLTRDEAEETPRGTRQRDADIAECLDTLDEEERAFVILWEGCLGELSQTEIARILGVLNSTISGRIKPNALEKLRECMGKKGYR